MVIGLLLVFNHQGGITSSGSTGRWKARGDFAIKFNKILTVVGTLKTMENELSNINYDDNIRYEKTHVTFQYNAHTYIAVGI